MLTTKEVNKKLNNISKKKLWLLNKGHLHDVDDNGDPIVVDNPVEDNNIPNEDNIEIKISDLINPNFYPLFDEKNPIKAPYRIFKGGRSSFKSSAISIKLVYKFLQDNKANVVCFRKVGKYLSTSVYEQIKWAIIMLNVQNEFTFLKSPLKIIHNKTNTAFYFYGVDDPLKIKSAKIAEGYVSDLWYEEAAEFEGKEEIDTVNDTFIRQDLPEGKEVEVYFSYNPPKNPYVWINEWLEEIKDDKDYYINHSTYEDDVRGFLSDQFVRRVKRVKETDRDYHDWMYGGKVTGLGNIIYNYNLFNIVEEIPDDDRLILADVPIDTGYSTSATTFLFIGFTLKKRVILLDTFYYSPINKVNKKAPSDFSKDLWKFMQDNISKYNVNIDTQVVDSADGAIRNQFSKDYGIYLTPARKSTKEDMIDYVRDLLANNRVYVLNTENNQIFLEEHKKYQWDEDSLEPGKEPKVVKVDDHTVDAFQYYVINNLQKLELKG